MWSFFNHLGSEHVKAVWCVNPSEDRALFVQEFRDSGVPTTALTSGMVKMETAGWPWFFKMKQNLATRNNQFDTKSISCFRGAVPLKPLNSDTEI